MPQTEPEEMCLDEETQADEVGMFCTIVDQERFEQDGTKYDIVTREDDEVQSVFDIVDAEGKIWLTVHCDKTDGEHPD